VAQRTKLLVKWCSTGVHFIINPRIHTSAALPSPGANVNYCGLTEKIFVEELFPKLKKELGLTYLNLNDNRGLCETQARRGFFGGTTRWQCLLGKGSKALSHTIAAIAP